jgi:hypothetical protein
LKFNTGMKKLLLFLLLCLGLTTTSIADYLDDWPDDALCGWMENPTPPSYMVEEVKTRGISCSGVIPVPPEIVIPCLLEPCDPIEPIVPPIRPGWKILEGTDMWVIDETDPYWQTPEGLKEKPPKIDPGIEYPPESLPGDPKIPDQPIRPGWKIAEGSNFWTIDEAAPYWETEEGSKEHKAAKERGSWIETEASRYAQENPNAPPPIPSYYATDPCGEGKQPANASC